MKETKVRTVLVLYHSQEYGNTKTMATAVAEGIRSAGAEAVLVNTNEKRMSMPEYAAFDAVAFGTPDYYSYIAGGLKMFLDDFHIAVKTGLEGMKDKPYGLFYSHGGGGKVLEPFESLFGRIGTKLGTTVESRGAPDGDVVEACKELGAALAR